MASAESAAKPAPPPVQEYAWLAALLSYLVPGLGQISQGRFGKGVLFFVCIYFLFFYGQALGSDVATVDNTEYRVASNVYLPDTASQNPVIVNLPGYGPARLPRLLGNLYNRPQFAGQFWVGMAAWPAVWQYANYDERVDRERNAELRFRIEGLRDAGQHNEATVLEKQLDRGDDLFGQYQRTPSESAINAVQAKGDKFIELGWVYTVIAGVLNVTVIYDALAGPAFVMRRAAAAIPPPPEQPAVESVTA